MWEYFDDQYFLGSPHWGLQNARPKAIEMSNFEDYKDEMTYSYNVRGDGRRSDDHFVDHFVKYYYVYGRSNHLLLGRENDQEEFKKHEENRQLFRFYCRHELGLDFTIESLKEHFAKGDWKDDDFFVSYVSEEKILKDFYRYHFLKHDLNDLEEKNGKVWTLEQEK